MPANFFRHIAIAFTVAAAAALSGCQSTGTGDVLDLEGAANVEATEVTPEIAGEGETRIALAIPLSGGQAAAGKEIRQGAELALGDLGAGKISLAFYDTAGSAGRVKGAAQAIGAAGTKLAAVAADTASLAAFAPQGAVPVAFVTNETPRPAGTFAFLPSAADSLAYGVRTALAAKPGEVVLFVPDSVPNAEAEALETRLSQMATTHAVRYGTARTSAQIAQRARKQLEKRGLKIMTEAKVTGVKKGANNVTATIEDKAGKKSDLTVDRVISAVGVQGNIEDIGLETTKVKTDRGCIVIDEYGRTAEPGIYAIGDVAGPPMLAHKAEHEGVICVEKIAGLNDVHPMKKEQIPGCTYCHPQVASVGLTEKKAKEAGYEVKVGRFPFIGNGKAIALGEPDGMVKTVFDAKTGELLGAHMVGAEVTELIQGYVVAMGLETTEAELMHTVFPHPTLSEMMHESVLDAYGRVIHM